MAGTEEFPTPECGEPGRDSAAERGLTEEASVRIRRRPRMVALCWLIGVAATLATLVSFRSNPVAGVALAAFVLVATWLSAIDIVEHRLPNRIVGALALAVTVFVVVFGLVEADMSRPVRSLLVGLAASALFLVFNFLFGVGMGDAKYAFPLFTLMEWLGAGAVEVGMLTTALSAGIAGGVVLATGRGRRFPIPYGPFLSLGAVAALLFSAPW